jgi:hypothetical protein
MRLWLVVFALVLLGVPARAGMAPPDVIPWDSVIMVDTIGTDRGGSPIVDSAWIYYITRTHYEVLVYGKTYEQVNETAAKLRKIEKYLTRRRDAGTKKEDDK